MAINPEILRALEAAGATTAMIIAAVEADFSAEQARADARKAKATAKKRRQRASLSPNVPGTGRDKEGQGGTPGDTPPPKERSPAPPKEITPTPTHTYVREADFPVWWDAYPHKVGKDYAIKVFAKLVEAETVTLDELISGTERYRKTKPASHEWCNPSTWLNQGRWKDQPAVAPAPPHHINGARASARNFGPTMAELATMDLPLRNYDDPRDCPAPKPKPDATDPQASGFVGRIPFEDRGHRVGQVLDIRSFSPVRG